MSDEEEHKLVYGMILSLKNMCDKLSLSGQTCVRARAAAPPR